MAAFRPLRWIAGVVVSLVLAAMLSIAIVGWNWLRGPIQRITAEKTGRVLAINGDLTVSFGWPSPRLKAGAVTFANPAWAKEKQMVVADGVEIAVSLPQLLLRRIVLPDVHLERPVVFLEQSPEGRKNWLLDVDQKDEAVRVRIDRLTLDRGKLGYDDAARKTSIRSELSTSGKGVSFSAQGQYLGLEVKARGSGGPVLAMRDEETPYPIKFDASVGPTRLRVDGSITSLVALKAVDIQLGLAGDSLEQLYPLLGIVFPATRAYAVDGQLVRAGNIWRYEKTSGRIGNSDISGVWQVETGGQRPALKAELASRQLDIADLGPLIGARPGPVLGRLLPDVPFKSDRWGSVDAEVSLRAGTIRRAGELPLENLVTHLSLRDSVVTLKPLDFGVAGGHLDGVITLDGRKAPIQARAQVRADKIRVDALFPGSALRKAGIGQVNGRLELSGSGNSVGQMLASADGKAGLIVAGGEISKLMMERVNLHLFEMLGLKLSGDRLVKLHCAVAAFEVKDGVMHTEALVFDTEVSTILGDGDVDMAQERLNLTLHPNSRHTSIVSLRSPVNVRGTFVKPQFGVDKGRVALRALGATALAAVNPLLAFVPLTDVGTGKDSDCAQLVRDAGALPGKGTGPKS